MRSLSPASLLPLGCLLLILGVMAASAEPEPEPRRNRGRKNDDIWQVEDEDEAEQPKEDRDGKLLNIFQVVRFPNSACNTTTNDQGVCFTAKECTARGGSNAGTCASGFGVCCSFSIGCGGTTSQNNTYFVSSDTDTSPCSATICKCSSDICQFRLDFDTFNIAQPFTSTVGAAALPITQCIDASFTATSDGPGAPIVCGNLQGQHMILEANEICNTLNFAFNVATPREWRIQVSQISCNDPNKPPEGCTQYFTGVTGNVMSYNFGNGNHLANQDYVNCIRAEQGFCTITWTENAVNSFAVSNTGVVSAQADACSTDYVTIPGGFIGTGFNDFTTDRLCGGDFIFMDTQLGTMSGSVNSITQPFTIRFTTNNDEVMTTDELATGFSLDYVQTMDNCT